MQRVISGGRGQNCQNRYKGTVKEGCYGCDDYRWSVSNDVVFMCQEFQYGEDVQRHENFLEFWERLSSCSIVFTPFIIL